MPVATVGYFPLRWAVCSSLNDILSFAESMACLRVFIFLSQVGALGFPARRAIRSPDFVWCTAPVSGATRFATFPIGFPRLPTSSPASILLPLTLLPRLLPQDSNLFPFCLIPMTRLPYMPSHLPHAFPTIPPSASNPPHLRG